MTEQQFRLAPQEYDPAIPVDSVTEHPANPNVGDTELLAEMLDEFGFMGAIIVQKSTGYILSGNHRHREAVAKGARTLPAFVVDVDDVQAAKWMAGDNESTRRGRNDLRKLLALLQPLGSLRGSGFTYDTLDDLTAQLKGPEELTGAPTGAGWAEDVDEQEARRARIGGYSDRKLGGELTEVILVFTVDEYEAFKGMLTEIRRTQGDDKMAAPQAVLAAMRVLTEGQASR